MSSPAQQNLEAAALEIEEHVAASGWDHPPALFALVRTKRLAEDPGPAKALGLTDSNAIDEHALTPIEQENLPDGALDRMLGRIAWPETVDGAAVSQEIMILPPEAEAARKSSSPDEAAAHPSRRDARLVVAVLRDGTSASVLRLRPNQAASEGEDVLTGPDLAPNLLQALLATFG